MTQNTTGCVKIIFGKLKVVNYRRFPTRNELYVGFSTASLCVKNEIINMDKFNSVEVEEVFNTYPDNIRKKMIFLRQLVFETAEEMDSVTNIEEALKWGEPSYITKCGSTIRMDWKESKPDQYAVYFHCKTKLVDTFKEIYKNQFKFEGNRAIVFNKNDKIPVNELKHCISLSLTYHNIKHLPMLGV